MKKYIFAITFVLSGLVGSAGWAEKNRLEGLVADDIIMLGEILINTGEGLSMLVKHKGKLYLCNVSTKRSVCWVSR
mgnify:CR=1 FL=1